MGQRRSDIRRLCRRTSAGGQGLRKGLTAGLTGGLALALAAACAPSAEEATAWPLACSFLPGQSVPGAPAGDVVDCARRGKEGRIAVRSKVARAHVAADTVGSVIVDGELLFLLASGRTVPALPFDNGADYFVEGLARTIRGGKVGFVDSGLDEIVPTVWDFAFPFESGLAVVCTGCRQEPDGEHRLVAGGEWGYIDTRGAVVVAVEHSRESLPAREDLHDG